MRKSCFSVSEEVARTHMLIPRIKLCSYLVYVLWSTLYYHFFRKLQLSKLFTVTWTSTVQIVLWHSDKWWWILHLLNFCLFTGTDNFTNLIITNWIIVYNQGLPALSVPLPSEVRQVATNNRAFSVAALCLWNPFLLEAHLAPSFF